MIRVRDIKVNVKDNNYMDVLLKKLKIKEDDIVSYRINKRSIDARKKDNVLYVYEIDLELKKEDKIKLDNNILKVEKEEYNFIPCGKDKLENIVIVGSGPAGLFSAYELSKHGYKVTVIERGEDVDSRVRTVEKFWKTNKLNRNSNVQFGEGGAGTFSDGKLSTGIKDKQNRIKEVLNVFYECGADEEILYDYMPHIGTDKLVNVVKNIRNNIINNGGVFRYNTTLTNINIEDNKLKSIEVNSNEIIPTDILVLAIGHSARDTFRLLNKVGVSMSSKPFAVGFRIIHNQDLINKSQYGNYYKYLPPASYKLTYTHTNGKGVYSFCMCPGGYVVNASSEDGMLVVNGMSNSNRESKSANSAIVVTVNSKDYGEELFDGVKFQENIEKYTYKLGNGLIPVQYVEDYKNNVTSDDIPTLDIKGSYVSKNLNSIFSDKINEAITSSIKYFDNKIHGFDNKESVFVGTETRTSSPIRIIRDENLESNIKGIYPAGEGAGYAGGITSAAVDGIKVFEAIASKYRSNYEEN